MKLFKIAALILIAFTSCKSNPEKSDIQTSDSLMLTDSMAQSMANSVELSEALLVIKSEMTEIESGEEGTDLDYKEADLKKAVSEIFNPKNHPCKLPESIMKKLKKGWMPDFVRDHISKVPQTVLYFSGQSMAAILHRVRIKSINGKERKFIVKGCPTYDVIDIDKYQDKQGFNSFLYSLDCSGYLIATLEASATVPGADITQKAESALKSKNSMFVAGGTIVSPIIMAYYGSSFGNIFDTNQRIAILQTLVELPKVIDTDSIIIPSTFEAIWCSKTGESSFNGEASFGGKVNAGFGVGSFKSNAATGGNLTRTGSFNNYSTYITGREFNKLPGFTIREVKDKIAQLQNQLINNIQ